MTHKRVRVDFREMPDYTKPERYEERKYQRERPDLWDGDDDEMMDEWGNDVGLFHEEFGDN